MRRIPFLFLIIELFSLVIYGCVVDTLNIRERGVYKLSYANIKSVFWIKPDSLAPCVTVDTVRGLLVLKRQLKSNTPILIKYSSYDEIINIKIHSPFTDTIQLDNSEHVTRNSGDLSSGNNNFVSGVNLLNFAIDNYSGFSVNAGADNHFNYHSPGGITVKGYINADNKIFSGEGAYLSDVSGMNINVSKNDNSIAIGDISYDLNNFRQKIIGFEANYKSRFGIIAGLDGGATDSKEITTEQNNLGPYKLLSSNDSLYYISPNSEKIFLNGKILKNGNDYTINYNRGIFELLPSVKVNEGDKLYVTYQLKSRYNLRHYIHVNGHINRDISISYDEIRDWEKNILGISYDSAVSYNDSEIVLNGAKLVGYNKGDYIKSGNHFVYVGYNMGNYRCFFSYVGDSSGDYIFSNSEHGFLFVGKDNGNYLPILKVHPPSMKRAISLQSHYKGIKGSFLVLQNRNNILLSNNTKYTFTSNVSYKTAYKTDMDTVTVAPSLRWFQNIRNTGFSDDIPLIKYNFNLKPTEYMNNILIPGLLLNYKYRDILSVHSKSSELLNKKIIRSINSAFLHINRFIFMSYSGNFITESSINIGELRSDYSLGIRNRNVTINAFHRIIDSDTVHFHENGINMGNNSALFSVYKKYRKQNSTMNYEFSFKANKLFLRMYIENCGDTISNQFDVRFSKQVRDFYISFTGNGGKYKPYFLIPQFIASSNGNYDYDSLNNSYYRVDKGHFIEELSYKQYKHPLETYNINFKILYDKLLSSSNIIEFKRDFVQSGDSVHKNDKLSIMSFARKNFNNKTLNLKYNSVFSYTLQWQTVSGEFLYRKSDSEIYTLNLGYDYYSDNTPFLMSQKSDFNCSAGYNFNLFIIELFSSYDTYRIPAVQNILHYGMKLSFTSNIGKLRLTISPVLSYNLYDNENHFGEIDEKFPRGYDMRLNLNIMQYLGNNTNLNFNADMRYNHVNGLFKSFNLSIGVNL